MNVKQISLPYKGINTDVDTSTSDSAFWDTVENVRLSGNKFVQRHGTAFKTFVGGDYDNILSFVSDYDLNGNNSETTLHVFWNNTQLYLTDVSTVKIFTFTDIVDVKVNRQKIYVLENHKSVGRWNQITEVGFSGGIWNTRTLFPHGQLTHPTSSVGAFMFDHLYNYIIGVDSWVVRYSDVITPKWYADLGGKVLKFAGSDSSYIYVLIEEDNGSRRLVKLDYESGETVESSVFSSNYDDVVFYKCTVNDCTIAVGYDNSSTKVKIDVIADSFGTRTVISSYKIEPPEYFDPFINSGALITLANGSSSYVCVASRVHDSLNKNCVQVVSVSIDKDGNLGTTQTDLSPLYHSEGTQPFSMGGGLDGTTYKIMLGLVDGVSTYNAAQISLDTTNGALSSVVIGETSRLQILQPAYKPSEDAFYLYGFNLTTDSFSMYKVLYGDDIVVTNVKNKLYICNVKHDLDSAANIEYRYTLVYTDGQESPLSINSFKYTEEQTSLTYYFYGTVIPDYIKSIRFYKKNNSDNQHYLVGEYEFTDSDRSVGATVTRVVDLATSNLVDTYYSLTEIPEADAMYPIAFSTFEFGNDRLYVGNLQDGEIVYNDRFSWSNIQKYGMIPRERYIEAGRGSGDAIKQLKFYEDALAIFKSGSIWFYDVSSYNPNEWYEIDVAENIGLKNKDSVISSPVGMFFLATNGFFVFRKGQQGGIVNLGANRVEELLRTNNYTKLFYDVFGKNIFLLNGSTTALVYNYEKDFFSTHEYKYSRNIVALRGGASEPKNGKTYLLGEYTTSSTSPTNYYFPLLEIGSYQTDSGVTILSTLTKSKLNIENPLFYKRFRRIVLNGSDTGLSATFDGINSSNNIININKELIDGVLEVKLTSGGEIFSIFVEYIPKRHAIWTV